jgi:hypothetical protein
MSGQISEKVSKVQQGFSVTMFDSGFLFEITGLSVSNPEEWHLVRIAVPNQDALIALIAEATSLPRA